MILNSDEKNIDMRKKKDSIGFELPTILPLATSSMVMKLTNYSRFEHVQMQMPYLRKGKSEVIGKLR